MAWYDQQPPMKMSLTEIKRKGLSALKRTRNYKRTTKGLQE